MTAGVNPRMKSQALSASALNVRPLVVPAHQGDSSERRALNLARVFGVTPRYNPHSTAPQGAGFMDISEVI